MSSTDGMKDFEKLNVVKISYQLARKFGFSKFYRHYVDRQIQILKMVSPEECSLIERYLNVIPQRRVPFKNSTRGPFGLSASLLLCLIII